MHWKREEMAFRLHIEEAEKRGAEFYNCGQGVDATKTIISIGSKTSKGRFNTYVDFGQQPPYVEHQWK